MAIPSGVEWDIGNVEYEWDNANFMVLPSGKYEKTMEHHHAINGKLTFMGRVMIYTIR